MKKLMKNKIMSRIIIITLCLPMYVFTLIGELYSDSRFTFIGTSAVYWLEIVSTVSGKDLSVLSSKIEMKNYNKKKMKKEIKYVKNNKEVSEEYKSRILALLIEAKKLGYRLYDNYFEENTNGPLHLSFIKSRYSTNKSTYFVLNPTNECVDIYIGNSEYGYEDIVSENEKKIEDIIPYLLEMIK